ncbi:MAG: hypothetical protein ABFC78_01735 [Methanoregula sp.]
MLTGRWTHMAVDFESKNQSPARSRIVLSSKTKNRIKEIIGKCEYCDANDCPGSLEVHQLGMLSRSPYRPDENPANIVIVLCEEHYLQACDGVIPKSTLKSKIAKRSEKIKRALRSLLEKHDRTYEGSNVKAVHDPDRFGIGAFLRGKQDKR